MIDLNKFIKEQLQKITVPMTYNENKIYIAKQGSKKLFSDFEIGQVYNIKIEDYILNPPQTFTLAANWNFGTVPPEKELTAKVLQIAGKMIKFECIGKTSNISWIGWIPKKSIEIM